MYQRLFFGEVSDFLKGLGGHLADLSIIEILTLTPLAALSWSSGSCPGLLLDLIAGSVANVLGDVASQPAIPIAPRGGAIAILVPVIYVIARVDHRRQRRPA